MFAISTITPEGTPPYYTGLTAAGTAPASQTVSVYYVIPANGTKSAPKKVAADGDGAWSARFGGEFDQGTEVEIHAECEGEKISAQGTLGAPSDEH